MCTVSVCFIEVFVVSKSIRVSFALKKIICLHEAKNYGRKLSYVRYFLPSLKQCFELGALDPAGDPT